RVAGSGQGALEPFPASRKIYVPGSLPGVRVPMREVQLAPTQPAGGGPAVANPPVTLYDTSGPYTDPDSATAIDLRAGLPPLRSAWIAGRGDVLELPAPTSEYGRQRLADPRLAHLRFAHLRRPLRARAGANVTQMHYARQGIVTPEMEFVAIRENQLRETAR